MKVNIKRSKKLKKINKKSHTFKKKINKSIKKKYIQSYKFKNQFGGGQVDPITTEKLKKKYVIFLRHTLDNKTPKQNLKPIIEKLNYKIKKKYGMLVYDFIFKNYNKNKDFKTNLESLIIWSHGKPNKTGFEPITAGMPGLHLYALVRPDSNAITFFDLIFTPLQKPSVY